MAVPKKRTSKSRRDQRRSHHAVRPVTSGDCPQCGSRKLPHHMCNGCGYYKGRQVMTLKQRNDSEDAQDTL